MSEAEIQETAASFIATAAINGLVNLSVQDPNQTRTPVCPGKGVWLKDGTDVPCRVVAQDELGNWCVLTETGYVRQYFDDEVV